MKIISLERCPPRGDLLSFTVGTVAVVCFIAATMWTWVISPPPPGGTVVEVRGVVARNESPRSIVKFTLTDGRQVWFGVSYSRARSRLIYEIKPGTEVLFRALQGPPGYYEGLVAIVDGEVVAQVESTAEEIRRSRPYLPFFYIGIIALWVFLFLLPRRGLRVRLFRRAKATEASASEDAGAAGPNGVAGGEGKDGAPPPPPATPPH